MKALNALTTLTLLTLFSCSSTNGSSQNENANDADSIEAAKELIGEWNILNIVINDSVGARPSELTPGIRQYFSFDSVGNFGVATNCNLFGGSYRAYGSALKLYNLSQTEIFCDDMQTENALKTILPAIDGFRMENDSVARLLTPNPQSYILMVKN